MEVAEAEVADGQAAEEGEVEEEEEEVVCSGNGSSNLRREAYGFNRLYRR